MNKERPVTCIYISAVCLMLFLAAAAPLIVEAGTSNAPIEPVHYDGAHDRLTIEVKDVSMGKLLRQISLRSGVEILMDPGAERLVSVQFANQSLETGLKQVLRGTSYMMVYEELSVQEAGKNQRDSTSLLIAVKVLPIGKMDDGHLKSVASVKARGVARLMDRNHVATNGVDDIAVYREQRWLAALKKMTPERRKKIEEAIEKREARLAASRKHREEVRARSAERRAERRSHR